MSSINSGGLGDTPVTAIKGISSKRAVQLRRLGILTWYDLISWFPRDFEDWKPVESLDQLIDGQEQTFIAIVSQNAVSTKKGRLTIQKTVLKADGMAISAVWFNQPWLLQKLEKNNLYRFRGRIKRDGRFFSVQNPIFEPYEESSDLPQLKPVYPLTEGLSQTMIRQWIQSVLPSMIGSVPEPIPAWIRKDNKLCAVDFAFNKIHQPTSLEEAELSRYRLAFEELFLVQGGLRILRQQRLLQRVSKPVEINEEKKTEIKRIISTLPFALTSAQKRTVKEIFLDMSNSRPMNRLVQGDVGSGKTVIAALAMYACALVGGQAVMMAPTSVLANQHYNSLAEFFKNTDMEIELLTGQTTASRRKIILEKIKNGACRIVVGTHALLEDKVVFDNLMLTITDEQHRFGVKQRSKLSKTDNLVPHTLVMSATPIPRTLGLILYGDLDISVIDELPAGRKPIETYTAASKDRKRVNDLIRKMVDQGRQVYIVCPMIEEATDSDLTSATALYNQLSQNDFAEYKVGLIHGGLKAAQKDSVMQSFYDGECQILVSTTVIEVGVDQPNAAMMVIENAERFGLAQLHQLRGRIGRGGHRSICVLMSDSQESLARERLKTLCHSQDGFLIAEKDLELRGPGDFFGTRQHGLPVFKLANLYRDRDIIAAVAKSLDDLFQKDPNLEKPEHQIMIEVLQNRYGDAFPDLAL